MSYERKARDFKLLKERIEKIYEIDVTNKVSILMYEYKNDKTKPGVEVFKEDIKTLYARAKDIEDELNEYILLERIGEIEGVTKVVEEMLLDSI